jgi:hypothetical protein
MSIERNERIRFHEKGTLDAVTRWIANHQDGIAEWLKNVRRQYQVDRANVGDSQRIAVLLLKDAVLGDPRRPGSHWRARCWRRDSRGRCRMESLARPQCFQ